MSVHMTINAEGFPTAFYDSILWPELPPGTIEITANQHAEFLEFQGLRRWNAETNRINHYTPPGPTQDELTAMMRAERDRRLSACDWVSLRALDTGEPAPAEWIEYRQALRDMPSQSNPEWPTEPDK